MKKMILQLFLAFAFIANPIVTTYSQLHADDNWEWGRAADYGDYGVGGDKNWGKVYESADSIGYQGFGNYSFKINSYKPTPWWNIQGPSASLGCGGFSFNGGFLSIINIDQLGDQLRDAGAALAWGILLGLVTSLPSLKEVWDTINKWARMIQDLLANACAIGEKVSKSAQSWALEKAGSDSKTFAEGISKMSPDFMSEAQDNISGFGKTITKGLEDANKWVTEPKTTTEKAKIRESLFRGMIPNYDQMYFSHIVTAIQSNLKLKPEDFFDDPEIRTNIGDKEKFWINLGHPKPMSNKRDANFRIILGSILIAKFGSYGLSSLNKDIIENIVEKALKDLSKGSGDQEKAAETIESIKQSISAESNTENYNLWEPLYHDNLKDMIVKWVENGDNNELGNSIALPYFYGLKANSEGPVPSYLAIVERSVTEDDSDNKSLSTFLGGDWNKGFDVIAADQLECLTQNNSLSGEVCSNLPPILDPQIRDWVYIYSHSTPDDQNQVRKYLEEKLKNDLRLVFIQYMKETCTVMFTSGSLMVSSGSTSTPTNGKQSGNSKDGKQEAADKMIKKCMDFADEIKKDILPPEYGPKREFDLKSAMENINRNNLQRAGSALR